jgi:hypothetical protein
VLKRQSAAGIAGDEKGGDWMMVEMQSIYMSKGGDWVPSSVIADQPTHTFIICFEYSFHDFIPELLDAG